MTKGSILLRCFRSLNASNDPNMEYLSDGITESVMNSLTHLPQLKVMAKSVADI